MSSVSPELERLIGEVGPPDSSAYRNLRGAVESSPALTEQMNAAVAQAHLKHFALLPKTEHAGANYSPLTQTINLKTSDLVTGDERVRNTLIFKLGHEIQHGFNRFDTARALDRFDREVQQTSGAGPGAAHDYTPPMRAMLSVNRTDEASAHIAGWNALVSKIKSARPNATLEDIYHSGFDYRDDFIEIDRGVRGPTYTVQPGIRLNPDASITPDAANLEAIGRRYFDKVPDDTKLGSHGNSNYTNFYATNLVSAICRAELSDPARAGSLTLDMKALKLDESLLEQNGISLREPPRSGERCAYRDTGAPQVERHFDHTADSHHYVPVNDARPGAAGPLLNRAGFPGRNASLDDPSSPGHALFIQVRDKLQAYNAQRDIALGARETDNLAGVLTARAHEEGLTRIDAIEPSTHRTEMWIAQGPLGTPQMRVMTR